MRQKGYSKFIRKLEGKTAYYPLPITITDKVLLKHFVKTYLSERVVLSTELMHGFHWQSAKIEGLNWPRIHSEQDFHGDLLYEVCLSWKEQLD